MERAYKGLQLKQPIPVDNVLNGRSVATIQTAFVLSEVDFERLQGGPPVTAASAGMLFSGVVGYAVSLGPKFGSLLDGSTSELTAWEIKTMLAGTSLSAVLYAIGFFWPNKKKKTMEKIAEHFNSAPPSSHIVGGRQ
jgi:hypothetical protein